MEEECSWMMFWGSLKMWLTCSRKLRGKRLKKSFCMEISWQQTAGCDFSQFRGEVTCCCVVFSYFHVFIQLGLADSNDFDTEYWHWTRLVNFWIGPHLSQIPVLSVLQGMYKWDPFWGVCGSERFWGVLVKAIARAEKNGANFGFWVLRCLWG